VAESQARNRLRKAVDLVADFALWEMKKYGHSQGKECAVTDEKAANIPIRRDPYTFEPHDLPCGQHAISLDPESPGEPFAEQEISRLGLRRPDVHLEQGEVLITPHKEDQGELYILKKGRVRIFKVTSEGRELTIDMVVAGVVFGEMALTVQQGQEMYAQAVEPSVVSPVSCAELEHLILEKPEVGVRIVRLLSERLRYYQSRMEDIGLKDAPSRLASFIRHLVEREGVVSRRGHRIPTHYTHEYLGTVINANRETVTRAFARLQNEGVVELHRRYIYVTDMEALERIAEDKALDLEHREQDTTLSMSDSPPAKPS
jgi:CRP/FNR family cyclic AMP-dependent transcriptional regulator